MKNSVIGIFVLYSMFSASCFAAEELVERAQTEADLQQVSREMNAACGTSVSVKIDWDSFAKSEWRDYSISSFCGAPAQTLADFCAAGEGAVKAYVRETIKRITCAYGGEGRRELLIDNGEIRNVVDFKAYNLNDFVRAALVEKL